MTTPFTDTRCPVCDFTLAEEFLFAEAQPLSTLGWPESESEAQAMPRHPLEFVSCPRCTHVWNRAFSYQDVPYRDKANQMFNNGNIWQGHLAQIRDRLRERLPATPCVVEIGCGDGSFLQGLADASGHQGRFIGFDPNAGGRQAPDIEFQARLFDPLSDIPAFQPDAIVIRHVLEHLTEPARLIEQLAWAAAQAGKPCLLLAETPCIDRVFPTRRIADFFYEHVSHFTTDSFRTLLQRGGKTIEIAQGYGGEVVFGYTELGVPENYLQRAEQTRQFAAENRVNRERIVDRLAALHRSGQRVALWGGTGKGAAFINHYGVDAQRFPLVVDSDPRKAGTHVPGSGQRIQFRDALLEQPVDVLIVPTQWRARDIIGEMQRTGIVVRRILIEHAGDLVDFAHGDHPY